MVSAARALRRRLRSGYSLVALAMAVTVMNVLVAAALPLWSTAIQRDKEEELISRGFQYAEAIRVFQKRQGRLPNKLSELLEVEPRSIRQLWDDPITGKRNWKAILLGQGTPIADLPGGSGPDGEEQGEEEDDEEEESPSAFGEPELPLGPIQGVHSRSKKESVKTLFGKQRYADWQFTVQLLQAVGVAPEQPIPRLNALNIGRPMRFQQGGAAPGLVPGGMPGGMQGLPSGSPPQPPKRGG